MAAMDASSVYKLCRHLLHCPQFIYCAIQRCRKSDELCRLSVALKSSPLSDPQIVQISISDTGVGSCLEEFQDLMYAPDPALGGKWGSKLYFGIGTEVSLSTSEIVDNLLAEFTRFLQKKVAIELMFDCGDLPHSRFGNVILANDCTSFSPASNIEHLKSGLEDYIFKHGNSLDNICRSCFSTNLNSSNYSFSLPVASGCLKVRSGVACCTESKKSADQVMEAVIIVSESSDSTICYTFMYVYFLTQCTVMLPPEKQKAGLGRSLVKKAIKLALNDLKEKNAGVLLSAHALKICSYAPDLAKTISGLILSSNDSNFQGECISLLGLQGQNFEKETVENYVKERIISVIELNDRKPQRSREAAPSLFEDGYFQEPDFLYVAFEEGEEAIDFLE
ncbi:hypothetical protein RJ639_000314 [Escallonia herrerae]|uniref:Uncharacterized protein n=1 Tax=Escallonia herrerae TaxID=1293975 RepID=A0AA88XFF1_9ASTE|nr:hypothetical protein RJ639_000314 [Escallonia herrerae]